MTEVTNLTPMGVELKSGLSEDEVMSKLLDLMYTELKGKVDLPDDEDLTFEKVIELSSDDIAEPMQAVPTLSERPPTWAFNGWYAFCLFGPFTTGKNQISLLLPGESKQDNLQKNGRKSVREIEKKQKCLENINDENNVRGMSWSTKIGIATLEMKSKDLQQQK